MILLLAGIEGKHRIKVDFQNRMVSYADKETELFSLCSFQDILNLFLEESVASCAAQLSRAQKTWDQIF